MAPIVTISSVIKAPETVFFKDPSKAALQNLQKIKAAKRAGKTQNDNNANEIRVKPLKRADYHDMLRYGISESKGEERSESRRKLAIALGAKPPKRTQKNFKHFLEQAKKDKNERQQVLDEQQTIQAAIQKAKLRTKTTKRRFKNRKQPASGKLDGQIGRYKHGIQ